MHSKNIYYYSADCGITKCSIKHCILTCPHFQWSASARRYLCAINAMVPVGGGRAPLPDGVSEARMRAEADRFRASYRARGLSRFERVNEIQRKYGVV